MTGELDTAFKASAWLAAGLEESGIDYAIGGAVAMSAYGAGRATHDVYVSEP
jgi:hypothetical protein